MMISTAKSPRNFLPSLLAGSLLGAVLLLTFILTGHGLGGSGFFMRLSASAGMAVAPAATLNNGYLGGLAATDSPLTGWITWQVLGMGLGALVSGIIGRRLWVGIDGVKVHGRAGRLVMALVGGTLAGFGARVAAGCTSGIGLSGAAMMALAGFVFLGAFFISGLVMSRLVKGGPQ